MHRRRFVAWIGLWLLGLPGRAGMAAAGNAKSFIDAAFQMRADAIASGDQAYGAVVVRGGEIVGYGPSRVVLKSDEDAHAEREAIRDAQVKLGLDLTGCVMYSTSRPCSACEAAASKAGIARMYFGRDAVDAGMPR